MSALHGLEIVLAGGSGGLGSAAVPMLVADGARVIVSYLQNAERARALGVPTVQADLTRSTDRARLLDASPGMYGLAVFAGDPARVSDPAALEEIMKRSWEINCAGPLLLAREAAARMRERKTAGAVVLISTMQAMALFAGSTAYATAKSALVHGARILAKEVRRDNIRVNVVSPGVTEAGMARASIAQGKYNKYIEDGAIARFGRAADVARAVRFLLEPDSYVTGQVLAVDGGMALS